MDRESTGPALTGCGALRRNSKLSYAAASRRRRIIQSLDPPIVVLGGFNYFAEFVRDHTGVVKSIYNTMGTLLTGLPMARIIADGPSLAGDAPPFVTASERVSCDAVNVVHGRVVSVTVPDVINENILAAVGVHEVGHAAIARVVVKALKEL